MRGGRRGWQRPGARPASATPMATSAPSRGSRATPSAAARRPSPSSPSRRRGRGSVVVVAAVVVLVIVVAGGAMLLTSSLSFLRSDPPNVDLPAADQANWSTIPSPEPAPPPSVTNPDCPTATVGKVSWGRDAGGTSNGVDAIKAFDYGYYVLRSGEKARAVVAPDAALVADAPTIQRAVDAMPAGTTHCLEITDTGGGVYEVRLAEFLPNSAAPNLTFQVIETGIRDGRTVITGIPTNVSIGE